MTPTRRKGVAVVGRPFTVTESLARANRARKQQAGPRNSTYWQAVERCALRGPFSGRDVTADAYGGVYSEKQFRTVVQALGRFVREGELVRLKRGAYDLASNHPGEVTGYAVDRVRTLLAIRPYTQAELAKLAGLSKQWVTKTLTRLRHRGLPVRKAVVYYIPKEKT